MAERQAAIRLTSRLGGQISRLDRDIVQLSRCGRVGRTSRHTQRRRYGEEMRYSGKGEESTALKTIDGGCGRR